MESIETKSSGRLASRGTKRTCLEDDCGERFYDLNKDPIACPYCNAVFVPKPEVIFNPKEYRKRPVYKLERPAPVVDKTETSNNNSTQTAVADDIEEQVVDSADAALLLDNDDAVEKETASEKKATSDEP